MKRFSLVVALLIGAESVPRHSHADEPAPTIEIKAVFAEVGPADWPEVQKSLGLSDKKASATSEDVPATLRDLKARKLVRITSEPRVTAPADGKAWMKLGDPETGIMDILEFTPAIKDAPEEAIVAQVRIREMKGKGKSRQVQEMDFGVKLAPNQMVAVEGKSLKKGGTHKLVFLAAKVK